MIPRVHVPTKWNPCCGVPVDRSSGTAVAMRLLYSNLYFGGVPSSVDASLALLKFYGCIGHATLNGVVVDFANLTDTSQAVIGKCLYDEPTKVSFSVPPNREFTLTTYFLWVWGRRVGLVVRALFSKLRAQPETEFCCVKTLVNAASRPIMTQLNPENQE